MDEYLPIAIGLNDVGAECWKGCENLKKAPELLRDNAAFIINESPAVFTNRNAITVSANIKCPNRKDCEVAIACMAHIAVALHSGDGGLVGTVELPLPDAETVA